LSQREFQRAQGGEGAQEVGEAVGSVLAADERHAFESSESPESSKDCVVVPQFTVTKFLQRTSTE
jgi:hypothetical protein